MPHVIDIERVMVGRFAPAEKRIDERKSTEARDAANGAIGGLIIGLLFGIAVLGTIGSDGIPGLFEAFLLVACGAFGGAMFGAIVGSTGIFAGKRH